MIGELQLQICITSLFRIHQFVCTYTHNLKITVCIKNVLHIEWLLYYQIRSFLRFRVAWEIWHPSQLFSDTLCECCKHKQKNTGHLQLYYTAIDSTTTQDDSPFVKSSKAVTVSKLLPHTYIAIWCQMKALLATMHHFIRIKWASLRHDL